jgi:regulator of protease activity HflC (stomatin/prohibitin superfamily)
MPADMNDYFNKKKKENNSSKQNNNGGGGDNIPKMPETPKFIKDMGNKSGLIYTIVFVLFILFVSKPFIIINEGERGIKVTTGKYDPTPLEPGLHFVIPFIQRIILVDSKVRIINYKILPEGMGRNNGVLNKAPVTVLDKRGLPVTIELTVQYKLNAMYASQTISTWGTNWEDKIINPVVRDIVRNVVGGYEAEKLPIKRNEIATKISTLIAKNVDALANNPVLLQSVQLRAINLPVEVKKQIERVQLAKQEVERAQQEVERAKQVAFARAEKARGEAEAAKIDAQGRADAVRIEADAQAKANVLISRSLTTNLLKLEQIKTQGKFNDALAVNKDAKIFLTPGGSTPNIWVDMKNSGRTKASTGR